MAEYIMALDAGTTSNRCILFDRYARVCAVAQKEFTQIYPKSGYVEHNANEIWATQLSVAVEAMQKLGIGAEDIAAIGITNQRETTIVWDRQTGEPVYNAIVWAMPPHEQILRRIEGARPCGDDTAKDRPCYRRIFFGHKAEMDTG